MLAASPCLQFIHPLFLTFCPACSAALAGTATAQFGLRTLRCQDIATATAAGRCCRCQVVIWHWDLHAFFEHGWIADDSRLFFFQPWESLEILSLFPCGAFGVLFLKFRLGPRALWGYTFWILLTVTLLFQRTCKYTSDPLLFSHSLCFVAIFPANAETRNAHQPLPKLQKFVIFEVVWLNWWRPTALPGRFAALRDDSSYKTQNIWKHVGVEPKIGVFTPKMDGLCHGKPY